MDVMNINEKLSFQLLQHVALIKVIVCLIVVLENDPDLSIPLIMRVVVQNLLVGDCRCSVN